MARLVSFKFGIVRAPGNQRATARNEIPRKLRKHR
jgi:hypothetical protein